MLCSCGLTFVLYSPEPVFTLIFYEHISMLYWFLALFQTAKDSVDVVCKCHGVSGSCSVKICWRRLKSFRAIGSALKNKFDGASFVRLDKKKKRLKRVTDRQKRPTKKDLVYLRESPDFCELNPELGSLGTRGRRCNKSSYGLDGCTLMCCGRGYYTLVQEEKDDCDCKFYWCCRVECRKCTRVREMNYCNWRDVVVLCKEMFLTLSTVKHLWLLIHPNHLRTGGHGPCAEMIDNIVWNQFRQSLNQKKFGTETR